VQSKQRKELQENMNVKRFISGMVLFPIVAVIIILGNQYIVDKADCLLAVCHKNKITARSGTNMTLQFALKKEIPIDIVDCSFCDE